MPRQAEMVYGSKLREIIHVMREVRTSGYELEDNSKQDVAAYLADVKEQLRDVAERAKTHADIAQQQYKRQYDKRSSVRCLNPGEKVLIVVPSSTKKLFAEFCGSHPVIRRKENDNYLIQLPKRTTILHINILKLFIEREEFVGEVLIAESHEEEDRIEFAIGIESHESEKKFKMGSQLNESQRNDLKRLFEEFEDIFRDRPGRTDLVQCKLTVKNNTPCRQTPYASHSSGSHSESAAFASLESESNAAALSQYFIPFLPSSLPVSALFARIFSNSNGSLSAKIASVSIPPPPAASPSGLTCPSSCSSSLSISATSSFSAFSAFLSMAMICAL